MPEGAKALFAKFPDYRMDIYPTRRSASAPQSVYDSVFQNATRAHAAPGGIATGIAGAAGGAYAGKKVEEKMNTHKVWTVHVRYEDGRTQQFEFTENPGLRAGDQVKNSGNSVVRY